MKKTIIMTIWVLIISSNSGNWMRVGEYTCAIFKQAFCVWRKSLSQQGADETSWRLPNFRALRRWIALSSQPDQISFKRQQQTTEKVKTSHDVFHSIYTFYIKLPRNKCLIWQASSLYARKCNTGRAFRCNISWRIDSMLVKWGIYSLEV